MAKTPPRDSSRRKFLKYGVVAAGAIAAAKIAGSPLFSVKSISNQTVQTYTTASTTTTKRIEVMDGKIPLIDVHAHLLGILTPDSLLEMMNSCATSRVVLMPKQGEQAKGEGVPDDYVFKFYEKDPERIIPLVGMQREELLVRSRWLSPDAVAQRILDLAESQLKTGIVKGIGEVIVRHYEYHTPDGKYVNPDVDQPIDSRFFYMLLDLAEEYDVPIDVHLEIDDKTLSPFETVLQNRPNAKIILAHSGRADTQTLKRLLTKYANLSIEVSCNTANCAYGQLEPESWCKNPHEDGKLGLRPEWKSFYEEWADRIVGVGTDFYRPTRYESNSYGPAMNYWRQLLWKNLGESTMRKIAYRNAEKTYLGMEW